MELVWDAAMVTRASSFVFQPGTIFDQVNMYASTFETTVLL